MALLAKELAALTKGQKLVFRCGEQTEVFDDFIEAIVVVAGKLTNRGVDVEIVSITRVWDDADISVGETIFAGRETLSSPPKAQ